MSKQTNCVGCDESPGSITMKGSVLVSKMFEDVTGLKGKTLGLNGYDPKFDSIILK
jgi:hypothetical protein